MCGNKLVTSKKILVFATHENQGAGHTTILDQGSREGFLGLEGCLSCAKGVDGAQRERFPAEQFPVGLAEAEIELLGRTIQGA